MKYKVIAQYMDKNKLILNGDKNHLLVMTSARKHLNHHNFGIYLNTGSEIIQPWSLERLLGANVSNSFTWNTHIKDGKGSLISSLNSGITLCPRLSVLKLHDKKDESQ